MGSRGKEIEVVRLENLTEKQVKKLRLLDNKISDMAEWNLENIKIELEDIGEIEFDELRDIDQMEEIQNTSE
jgi:hypothetical protein